MLQELMEDLDTDLPQMKFVSERDAGRIKRLVDGMRLRQDALEEDMYRHMDLVDELGYLTTKYDEIHKKAVHKLENYAGEVVATQRKHLISIGGKITDFSLKAAVESDQIYQEYSADIDAKKRLLDFLDTLRWSLKDRSAIANSLIQRQ